MVAGQTNQSGKPTGTDYVMPQMSGSYGSVQHARNGDPAFGDPLAPGEVDRWGSHSYSTSPIGAWAPRLRMFPGGTPDPGRTLNEPLYDYRPDPLDQPPGHWWTGRGPGHDGLARTRNNEFIDADGLPLRRDPGYAGDKRAAPDHRRTPPPETRKTQEMSPHRYVYTRAFDQRVKHHLTGEHFSLADHRRTYPVFGMVPVVSRRNTYRADPAPWDTGIVDVPIGQPYSGSSGEIPVQGGHINGTRTFRLG